MSVSVDRRKVAVVGSMWIEGSIEDLFSFAKLHRSFRSSSCTPFMLWFVASGIDLSKHGRAGSKRSKSWEFEK